MAMPKKYIYQSLNTEYWYDNGQGAGHICDLSPARSMRTPYGINTGLAEIRNVAVATTTSGRFAVPEFVMIER